MSYSLTPVWKLYNVFKTYFREALTPATRLSVKFKSKHLFTDDHDGVQLDDQVERCMLLAFPSVCCCNHFSRVTVVISQRVRGSIYRETMRTISKKVSSHLFSPLGRREVGLCGEEFPKFPDRKHLELIRYHLLPFVKHL